MTSKNVYVKLANGLPMPQLGLGTWLSKTNEVSAAVSEAIEVGYRHIDSASAYGNEGEAGAGIRAKIEDGTVKREDLFITTKVKPVDNRSEDVEAACRASLENLGIDYIDLYLMHWPFTFDKSHGVIVPKGPDGMVIPDDQADYLDTWRAMEVLVDKGLVRAIGVCNFNQTQLERLLALPRRIPISNLQIEGHPYLTNEPILELCKANNILLTAYSPLGAPARPVQADSDPILLEDPVVVDMARSKGCTPAQLLIRFQLDRGVAVIPKSVTPSRILANFEALDYKLTDEEVQRLSALNRNFRYIYFPAARSCKHHPYK